MQRCSRRPSGSEILQQSDRSNYHLLTSPAPALMKSTTLQQTSCALKLTFTFVITKSVVIWIPAEGMSQNREKEICNKAEFMKGRAFIQCHYPSIAAATAPTCYLPPPPDSSFSLTSRSKCHFHRGFDALQSSLLSSNVSCS